MRRERPLVTGKTAPINASLEDISFRLHRGRDSLSEELDLEGYGGGYRFSDFGMDSLDHAVVNESPRSPIASQNVSKFHQTCTLRHLHFPIFSFMEM